MASRSPVALLNVAQNGQVTIPASFRKTNALAKGGKLMAVCLGDTLVMVPHDGLLEAICMKFEEALHGTGVSVAEINAQASEERAQIVEKRYGHLLTQTKTKRRK
jgi:bifunctional DNA-binding transcriptional regulator/antitoxin component of YhaV-PrlF toxin-antitoxin module